MSIGLCSSQTNTKSANETITANGKDEVDDKDDIDDDNDKSNAEAAAKTSTDAAAKAAAAKTMEEAAAATKASAKATAEAAAGVSGNGEGGEGGLGGGDGGGGGGRGSGRSGGAYAVMPIILKNRIPTDVKQDPKKLSQILQNLKPQAKFSNRETSKLSECIHMIMESCAKNGLTTSSLVESPQCYPQRNPLISQF